MTSIRIEKSTDDKPVYKVFRVTENKGRIVEFTLVLETQDFKRVSQMLIEW